MSAVFSSAVNEFDNSTSLIWDAFTGEFTFGFDDPIVVDSLVVAIVAFEWDIGFDEPTIDVPGWTSFASYAVEGGYSAIAYWKIVTDTGMTIDGTITDPTEGPGPPNIILANFSGTYSGSPFKSDITTGTDVDGMANPITVSSAPCLGVCMSHRDKLQTSSGWTLEYDETANHGSVATRTFFATGLKTGEMAEMLSLSESPYAVSFAIDDTAGLRVLLGHPYRPRV